MNLGNILRRLKGEPEIHNGKPGVIEADWEIVVDSESDDEPERREMVFCVLCGGRLVKAKFAAERTRDNSRPGTITCSVIEIDGVPTPENQRNLRSVCIRFHDVLPNTENQYSLIKETLAKFGIKEPPMLVSEDYVRGFTKVLDLKKRLEPQPKED